MIGESEVSDFSFFSFFQKEIEHTVVDEPFLELIHASTTNTMEQIIVDVVHLKFLERLLIHLHGFFLRPFRLSEIRELGSHVEALAWETTGLQRRSQSFFRLVSLIVR